MDQHNDTTQAANNITAAPASSPGRAPGLLFPTIPLNKWTSQMFDEDRAEADRQFRQKIMEHKRLWDQFIERKQTW